MPDLESNLEQELNNSRSTLGPNVPRLITRKPQVCINGLRHGITGQSTFLTNDDLVTYLQSGVEWILEMCPMGVRENHLLQRMIDTDWRLTRIPFIEENIQKAIFLRELEKLRTAHPNVSDQTLEVYAQAASFRESTGDLEKISRHETRLHRLMKSMSAEYDHLQDQRTRRSLDRFNPKESAAYIWYSKISAAANRLMEAREELNQKTEIVVEQVPVETAGESTTSEPKLALKKSLHIIAPLTDETTEGLAAGHAWGLLTEIERTLFTDMRAA